ncbi:MAG: hypothetical protein ACXACR_03380, partial [Candidatus Hodarchaeales archaeon]
KRVIFLFLMLVFLLINVGSVSLNPGEIEAISEVDFSLIGSSLTQIKQGVYKFTATVKNNGSDAALSGSVPISWEKITYDLPLSNGIGVLDESTVNYDLNGDSDKTDTFDVTWFHNTTRPWDAVINDGTKDIHAYALNEGTTSDPGSNRTYYINGMSKFFHLGTESHSLIIATNDSASFGLGQAFIKDHPSPNFELLLISSKVNAFDFKINDDPVGQDFSSTFTAMEPYWTNTPTNASVYVVPDLGSEIAAGEETTFSCTLVAYEDITFELILIINWSPDGISRHRWISVVDVVSLQAINRPYFISVDSVFTQINTGVKQFKGVVKNIGAPATTGLVPMFWEPDYYPLALNGGDGVLDESDIGLDLDGDGNTADTFTVTWLDSPTRPCDANVDGKYVYAILDQPQSPWYNLTYNFGGQSKLFQLGSKTHCLYFADANVAEFGLCGTLREHPSPSFKLVSFANVIADDFKINGNPVNEDYSEPFVLWYPDQEVNYTTYVIPNQAFNIGTEEEITLSCNLGASETITTEVVLAINWSPDGNIRYMWRTFAEETTIEVTTTPTSTLPTTTTSPTSSETTPTVGVPGFSFLPFLLILPLLIYRKKRKKV